MGPLEIALKALNNIADSNEKKSTKQLIKIATDARTAINEIYNRRAESDKQTNDMYTAAKTKNNERMHSVQSEIIEMETIINDPGSSEMAKREGRKHLDRLNKMLADLLHQQI